MPRDKVRSARKRRVSTETDQDLQCMLGQRLDFIDSLSSSLQSELTKGVKTLPVLSAIEDKKEELDRLIFQRDSLITELNKRKKIVTKQDQNRIGSQKIKLLIISTDIKDVKLEPSILPDKFNPKKPPERTEFLFYSPEELKDKQDYIQLQGKMRAIREGPFKVTCPEVDEVSSSSSSTTSLVSVQSRDIS